MDNPDRVTYFAATDSRGQRTPFGLKAKDRQRHMYVIGKTGMGKSTLLENMAIQDIQNGEGLAFIDPHGSAVETLLNYIPEHRVKDVVYFAPFDLDQPIAFNVMEDVGYDKRHLVTSGLMATFKKIWEDAWSARMEYILTNTLLALLEYPDATLLGVNRMYTDKNYRKKVVDNVKDPVVKDFWTKEFANYTDRFTQEATPAIQNKIGQFTSNPLIRNIIGQPKSSFDIRDMMDNKKIFLINLSKGLVGDTNMRLLGSMLVTRIFLGAMSRADLPPEQLKKAKNFYLYVDEFQNFANDTFSEILSEARKYSLNLLIAHQYVEQMEEQVRAAVFGNVGTTVAFRVGPFDAETLETVFSPEFLKEDLVNLGFAQIYLTLMIDGVGSRPFSAVTLPPIEPPVHTFRDQVIESSRQKYGAPRAAIEKAVFDELMAAEEAAAAEAPPKRAAPGSRPSGASTGARGNGGGGGTSSGARSEAPRRNDAPRREEAPRRDEGAQQRAASNGGGQHESPRTNNAPRREERSERTERPRDDRAQDRPRPTPPAEGKSAEDLKAILRSMTANIPKSEKGTDGPSPLKGALAGVMTQPSANSTPTSNPKPKDGDRRPERQEKEEQPAKNAAEENRPFEVPEADLRAIFSEPK